MKINIFNTKRNTHFSKKNAICAKLHTKKGPEGPKIYSNSEYYN